MARSNWFVDGFRFDKELWDPSHRFATSWLLSPWLLFACRALISIFIFTTRFFIIAYECTSSTRRGCSAVVDSFSYFTVLTFWGLAFYFAFAALHTLTYALRGRPLLDSFPRPLQALHALFYTTVVTYPFIVTIVYWAIIYESPWYDTEFSAFTNIAQHALNLAFALFEIFVPRTSHRQMRPVHMLWIIVILALYLALAYLTKATRGFYVYAFLDPSNGGGLLAAYIVGIAVAGLLFFGIAKGLIWVRQWLTERVLGMDGKFAGQPGYAGDTELGTIGRSSKNSRRPDETEGLDEAEMDMRQQEQPYPQTHEPTAHQRF